MGMSKFTGTAAQRRLQAILRQARQDAGLKQSELADKINEPQSFVSKYESGERRLDLLELHQICEVLGVPLVELIRRFEDSIDEAKHTIPQTTKTLLGKRTKR